MTKKLRWALVGLVLTAGLGTVAAYGLLPLNGSGASAAGMAPDNAAKVELGRQLYADNCASCHGVNLEGQANWRQRRPDGRLPAPPHDAGGHTWHHPDAQLFALTKYGPAALAGGGYQSDMPGYEGRLSDEEIWAVLSFIKSRWPAEIRDRHDQIAR
jgi:mono/diheme cytochrome c family protein